MDFRSIKPRKSGGLRNLETVKLYITGLCVFFLGQWWVQGGLWHCHETCLCSYHIWPGSCRDRHMLVFEWSWGNLKIAKRHRSDVVQIRKNKLCRGPERTTAVCTCKYYWIKICYEISNYKISIKTQAHYINKYATKYCFNYLLKLYKWYHEHVINELINQELNINFILRRRNAL